MLICGVYKYMAANLLNRLATYSIEHLDGPI